MNANPIPVNMYKSMEAKYSKANPVLVAMQQIGTDAVIKFALASGCDTLDQYLAMFEPKQQYEQVPIGAGEGTSASEVEHYIDMRNKFVPRV